MIMSLAKLVAGAFIFMLAAGTLLSAGAVDLPVEIITRSAIEACDPNDLSTAIGTFDPFTTLTVTEFLKDKNLYRVKFSNGGQVMEAVCKAEHIERCLKPERAEISAAPAPSTEAKPEGTVAPAASKPAPPAPAAKEAPKAKGESVLTAAVKGGKTLAEEKRTAAASFKPSNMPADELISDQPGLAEYQAKAGKFDNGSFLVYIPASYSAAAPMPLVVSSHGAGGTCKAEFPQWKGFADQHRFIVVCPSYAGATPVPGQTIAQRYQESARVMNEVMKRVLGSLNIDRRYVMHTGFSGGGTPTWLAMNHPEWFTALCFRSANFFGEASYGKLKSGSWKDRPIYMFWGTKDHPIIIEKSVVAPHGEGPMGLEFVKKKVRCTKLKHEVIEGGGHASRPDRATAWFVQLIKGAP